jgi:hypothetical protein
MSKDDIKNELRYNQEKLRLANTSGDRDLKKKVQNQCLPKHLLSVF